MRERELGGEREREEGKRERGIRGDKEYSWGVGRRKGNRFDFVCIRAHLCRRMNTWFVYISEL